MRGGGVDIFLKPKKRRKILQLLNIGYYLEKSALACRIMVKMSYFCML